MRTASHMYKLIDVKCITYGAPGAAKVPEPCNVHVS